MKSAWETLRIPAPSHKYFDKIWEKDLHFKVSFFVWRLFKKRIPIGEFWARIGVWMISFAIVVIRW